MPVDFACVKAGINRVPLNARLSLEEHARMLKETGAGVLLYGADLAERAAALCNALPGLACHGIGGESDDLLAAARACSDAAPDVAVAPDDVILTLLLPAPPAPSKQRSIPRLPTLEYARTYC